MRLVNDKLAAELLEKGKTEFLEKGFQGASLRSIAASLGVTTGAIYRYYTDKEALFDALVAAPAEEMERRYRKAQQEFATLPLDQEIMVLPKVSESGHDWMIDFLYDNLDAFKLITGCSTGTKYEHYIDVLIEIETNSGRSLIDKMTAAGMKISPIDDNLIHIVSSALFSGMFETVRHDMPRHKATEYLECLKKFYTAGWFCILGISGK